MIMPRGKKKQFYLVDALDFGDLRGSFAISRELEKNAIVCL